MSIFRHSKEEIIEIVGEALKKSNPVLDIHYLPFINLIQFRGVPSLKSFNILNQKLTALADHLGVEFKQEPEKLIVVKKEKKK